MESFLVQALFFGCRLRRRFGDIGVDVARILFAQHVAERGHTGVGEGAVEVDPLEGIVRFGRHLPQIGIAAVEVRAPMAARAIGVEQFAAARDLRGRTAILRGRGKPTGCCRKIL